MRKPSLDIDYWELESGEVRHEAAPQTFLIPPRSDRERLQRGQRAKLLFALEGQEEDGTVAVQVERMWVVVSEVLGEDTFIGILENEPASYEPSADVYLVLGAEVPFRAEDVIELSDLPPPSEEVQLLAPTRRWPRY